MLDYLYNQGPKTLTKPPREGKVEDIHNQCSKFEGNKQTYFGNSQSPPSKGMFGPLSSSTPHKHSSADNQGADYSRQSVSTAHTTFSKYYSASEACFDHENISAADAPSGAEPSDLQSEEHMHKPHSDPFSFTFSGHNNGRSLLAAQISSKFDDVVVHHTNTIDNATFGSISKDRYKTELCRSWAETGYCRYGDKCQFAHGCTELRQVSRHHKYKSELCNNFHYEGTCMYGTRCCFIHSVDKAVIGRAVSQNIDIVPFTPIANKTNSLIKSYDDKLEHKLEDAKQQQPERDHPRSYSASCTL